MATFAGKQAGYDDPTMRHETDIVESADAVTFAGKQAGYADPTVSGKVKEREKVQSG